MITLPELDFSKVAGKRVLLRSSLNVPIAGGMVANQFRLVESLKTIELLSRYRARTVLCGHIGRTKTDSLVPVWQALLRRSKIKICFSDHVVGKQVEQEVAKLQDSDVLLLENIRREPGEEKNEPAFAEALSRLGQLYVNDAFSDSHRTHASIIGVPNLLPHVAGPNFIYEFRGIEPSRNPPSPSIAIVGGAKFLTKEPILHTLLKKYDHVFVGGALANDFLLAKGFEVGTSLVSRREISSALLTNSKIILPHDVVVEGSDGVRQAAPEDISPNESVLDVGPKTINALAPLLKKARFILWNGPMGNFERGFREGTESMAHLVAESAAHSVIGGGDTIHAIEKLGLNGRFAHVSTAGGAMLQYIANGTLPGIEALKNSDQFKVKETVP